MALNKYYSYQLDVRIKVRCLNVGVLTKSANPGVDSGFLNLLVSKNLLRTRITSILFISAAFSKISQASKTS